MAEGQRFMSTPDIRWMQRFEHFLLALRQLQEAVELARQRPLTRLEEQGTIQAFEYPHDLAWNTPKDFLESRGVAGMYGSRDATREAFKVGLITNGEIWMDMIRSRNQSMHTYNEATARRIVEAILSGYAAEFASLRAVMEKHRQDGNA
jgi:nucleotidyltransferase substrate binding protein (TIGR01987 family)